MNLRVYRCWPLYLLALISAGCVTAPAPEPAATATPVTAAAPPPPPAAAAPVRYQGEIACGDDNCPTLLLTLELDPDSHRFVAWEAPADHSAPRQKVNSGHWDRIDQPDDWPDSQLLHLRDPQRNDQRYLLILDDHTLKLLDDDRQEFWSPFNLLLHRL